MSATVEKMFLEERFYDTYYAIKMLDEGKGAALRQYLSNLENKQKSGLSVSEIDALKKRVEDAVKEQNGR